MFVLQTAGKSFFKKRKVPIPVNLERKDWAAQIQKALDGTYLNKNGGSCLSIRLVPFTQHIAVTRTLEVLSVLSILHHIKSVFNAVGPCASSIEAMQSSNLGNAAFSLTSMAVKAFVP